LTTTPAHSFRLLGICSIKHTLFIFFTPVLFVRINVPPASTNLYNSVVTLSSVKYSVGAITTLYLFKLSLQFIISVPTPSLISAL